MPRTGTGAVACFLQSWIMVLYHILFFALEKLFDDYKIP
jgi:hypothetical protein